MSTYDWVEQYAHRTLTTELLEDGSVAFNYNSPKPKLDLENVPNGVRIEVTITFPNPATLQIQNGRSEHWITVRSHCQVTVSEGRLGTLEFRLPRGRAHSKCTFSGTADHVAASKGTVTLGQAEIGVLHLVGGTVDGDLTHVHDFLLRGESTVPHGAKRIRIDPDGATIRVAPKLNIEHLELPGFSPSDVTLTLQGQEKRARALLTVEQIDGSGTIVLEGSDLSLAGSNGPLVVEGEGELRIPANRMVTDLTVRDNAFVSARPGATLTRFSGHLKVLDCRYATVAAQSGTSFEYSGLQRRPASQQLGSDALRGATLRGVLIRDNAAGRRFLQDLQKAAVVEPSVDHLRVRSAAWRRPFAGRRLTRNDESRQAVDDASFFAQELAGLVDRKCGAGSVRTKTNWAAYRGRHLTAQSRWERGILGLFRLVGYGQRPGPPAAMWVILALLFTLPTLALSEELPTMAVQSAAAAREIIEQFLSLLLSPLVLLRLAGDPQLANITEFPALILVLIRTLVAAPFIFFVVAMARFLRADWPLIGTSSIGQ